MQDCCEAWHGSECVVVSVRWCWDVGGIWQARGAGVPRAGLVFHNHYSPLHMALQPFICWLCYCTPACVDQTYTLIWQTHLLLLWYKIHLFLVIVSFLTRLYNLTSTSSWNVSAFWVNTWNWNVISWWYGQSFVAALVLFWHASFQGDVANGGLLLTAMVQTHSSCISYNTTIFLTCCGVRMLADPLLIEWHDCSWWCFFLVLL